MNLIEIIRELAEKNHITAYEISKNTSISINTVRNVLTNSEIKTKEKTLKIILDYLEKAAAGTKSSYELKDKYIKTDRSEFKKEFKDLKIDDKLNIIHQQNLEHAEKTDVISEALLNITFKIMELQKEKNPKLS
tara:strand:- start:2148 stop:2549 length:402 start_codon:yes stop_codon:yes gene_type:complete